MNISTTNADQELTEIGASGSGTKYYFFNSEMREHMFDKVLTPSDVGKLNRLVIPKQHAENYFPLEDNQNGTFLDFQDRLGKMWRFRYSYWNSSHSYVMTKGWSRFVKEKNLSSGDTVSFHRGYIPDDNAPEKRLKIVLIDWSHKPARNEHNSDFGSYPTVTFYPAPEGPEYSNVPSLWSCPPFHHNQYQERESPGYGYGRIVNGGRYYEGSPLDHHHQWNLGRSQPLVYESVPVFPPAMRVPPPAPPQPSTTRKLRLFGVDVEESSSSGATRGEKGVAGHSSSSPVVIRDDDESSLRSSRGEMGAGTSSAMQLCDDEDYKRKGKSLEL